MSRRLDNRLLLNRHALQQLRQAGLGELAAGLPDMNAARRFALWSRQPGAEVYLFALLNAATRQTAWHCFARLGVQATLGTIQAAGRQHNVPELACAYALFPDAYPQEDLSQASQPHETSVPQASRLRLLAELYLLEVLVDNPAAQPFARFFDDTELRGQLDYHALVDRLDRVLQTGAGPAALRQGLSEFLKAPMRRAPHRLADQVAYIVENWSDWLPEGLITALKIARATHIEESTPRQPGPGPTMAPRFGKEDGSDSPAAFSDDVDWMSSAVLLAKSIYVWLDQLSSHYQRRITGLADIPDEELALLSSRGFNALWLIGIWERSAASRKIKQLCGNPEAEASAYALHAYRVAEDLGGDEGLHHLEERCRRQGIRLACDVVPNHTGIDSEWVLQHPDWFLQADTPPYPAYRFNGPDLCLAEGISIRIEDGYWDHSDAAVVCEHHDHRTGRRRYIYHGNDGTHMPWNDTAQLNFLLPQVRQAMSDLIVTIAQRFSMIRFDAAMTLARKHFRRLWFPPPGGSAGVPSRSAFCLSDPDFDEAFPVEFWRDVVDRIRSEAPDTLLIAEAFWLMESYFVRNLGMHRVYNSAFMNMLKREENAKYRGILKDILAYNPEILKRYVNFMNNPDEATAVEQFGSGDKYFGVATLLATLPGLPMFGHGQIEGFREKYGMEYRRAYWSESPDRGFVAHHEHRIFPLLRLRPWFAGVEHFSLYDFTTAHGIDENVFAFSNGTGGQKLLVVYNNSPEPTRGRVHQAVPKAAADQEGEARPMPVLAQALGLDSGPGSFCRFRTIQGAEYLLRGEQLAAGLELHLNGYECHVYRDFQVLEDRDGHWRALQEALQGQAVDNLDRARQRLQYQPLWDALIRLFDFERLHVLSGSLQASPQPDFCQSVLATLLEEFEQLVAELCSAAGLQASAASPGGAAELLAGLPSRLGSLEQADMPVTLLSQMWQGRRMQHGLGVSLLSWLLLHSLGHRLGLGTDQRCLELLSGFGLDFAWQEQATTPAEETDVFLAILLMKTSGQHPHPAMSHTAFVELMTAPEQAALLGINRHAHQTWFTQEGLQALAGAMALQAALMPAGEPGSVTASDKTLAEASERLRERLARAAAVGYRLDKFLQLG